MTEIVKGKAGDNFEKMTGSRREMLYCLYSYLRRINIIKMEDVSRSNLDTDVLDQVTKLYLAAEVYNIIRTDLVDIKDIPSAMNHDVYVQTVYAELMESELNCNMIQVAKCDYYIKGLIEDESNFIYYADDDTIYDNLIYQRIEPWYSKRYESKEDQA